MQEDYREQLSKAKQTTCEKKFQTKRWKEHERIIYEIEKYTGTPADVDFENSRFPEAENYRTKIREAVQAGPNFAGKYTVAEWGCGATCSNAAVINVETGEILYFGLRAEVGYLYSIDSTELIVNPGNEHYANDEGFKDVAWHNKTVWTRDYYYLMDFDSEEQLRLVCRESAAEELKWLFEEL